MNRMKLHLPWVTLTGTPDGPGFGPKAKCFGAMLLHEVVELTVGSQRAHAMASCRRYAVEAVVALGVGEAAAGAAEAGAAAEGAEAAGSAVEAGAGAGSGAAGESVAAKSAGVGQFKNLNPMQFTSPEGAIEGIADTALRMAAGHQVPLPANTAYDDPGHTS